MTWTDPAVGETFFVTNAIPTQANFTTYIFENLLGVLHPYKSEYASKDVVSSVAETTLFTTAGPTVTGGDLGVEGRVHAVLFGDFLNSTVAQTVTVRVKFGATTFTTTAFTGVANAGRFNWTMNIEMWNANATNDQRATLSMLFPVASGGIANVTVARGTAVEDSTANKTFDVTAQWGAADVNHSFRCFERKVWLAKG